MSDHSAIEWTDATWNPTTGCTKVSPACANCYIERTPPFRIAGRKFVNGYIPLAFHDERLTAPLKWRKPRRVFVNSLSDLFHADVPDAFIDEVFAVMALAPQHRFQVLTKRPERMRQYLTTESADGDRCDFIAATANERMTDRDGRLSVTFLKRGAWPLPNVWLGVSVENQHFADERIPLLLQTPAAVRFISAEPLLGPVDLNALPALNGDPSWDASALHGVQECAFGDGPVLRGAINKLDWVIVGGESGPRLRPTKPEWVQDIRDQCVDAGVKFFFKQWGGATAKAGGRVLDGRTWDELPA